MVVVKPVGGGRRLEITREPNCNSRRKMLIFMGVRHTSSKCLTFYRIIKLLLKDPHPAAQEG